MKNKMGFPPAKMHLLDKVFEIAEEKLLSDTEYAVGSEIYTELNSLRALRTQVMSPIAETSLTPFEVVTICQEMIKIVSEVYKWTFSSYDMITVSGNTIRIYAQFELDCMPIVIDYESDGGTITISSTTPERIIL